MSFFLDTPVGRFINTASSGRWLQKQEQQPDFVIPEVLARQIRGEEKKTRTSHDPVPEGDAAQKHERSGVNTPASTLCEHGVDPEKQVQSAEAYKGPEVQANLKTTSAEQDSAVLTGNQQAGAGKLLKGDAEAQAEVILVSWYGDDDPENPQNFTFARKVLVTICICVLTFSVYGGSSIVTPGIPGVMAEFDVGLTKGTMLLSVFVMGYAVGPLFLGPPSDMPTIGRSIPYWVSMLCLVLFNVGAARAQSYGTLVAMRLLSGIAGSPALATGGATLGDVWKDLALPKAISIWAIGAVCGPVLAPVIAGWAAQNVSWRLPLWLFTAMSGIGFLITLFLLPETLGANVLYKRAVRLRKLTGDQRLRSQGELDQAATTTSAFLTKSFYEPIRISLEPIVLYSSVLLGLVYAIFYCAFESVPLIYGGMHGFNTGETTLTFLALGVFGVIALAVYLAYLTYWFDPRFIRKAQQGIIDPEDRIILALLSAPLVLLSLLWTGWTAKPTISYWSPLIAQGIYVIPVFYLFQAVLTYLAFTYAEHSQAVFAANALIRSLIASAFPLFSHGLFTNLGLGVGYTILAACSLALLLPLWGLFKYGPWLRRHSPYAHNYSAPTSS